MDRDRLYSILDIESPRDFQYYEDLETLLEEEKFIEEELIRDLLRDVDKGVLAEHLDSFFEAFLDHLPEEEGDLYMIVDTVKDSLIGMISEDMPEEDISGLAAEIFKFRKWYVIDQNVTDRISGEKTSVRDARYEVVSSKYTGKKVDFDFSAALDYALEGFDVKIYNLIPDEEDRD